MERCRQWGLPNYLICLQYCRHAEMGYSFWVTHFGLLLPSLCPSIIELGLCVDIGLYIHISCVLLVTPAPARGRQAAHHYAHLSPSLRSSAQYWTHLDSITLLIAPLSAPQFCSGSALMALTFSPVQPLSLFVSCLLSIKCSLPVLASRLPALAFTPLLYSLFLVSNVDCVSVH
jgi:hypothetical protein